MAPKEFVPIVPAGFEIAGSFNGVTTAVGQGGAPRIRYQIVGMSFRTKGIAGFAMKQIMTRGIGDEVTLGSLHSKLEMAMTLVGAQPEAGVVERLETHPLAGLVLGRYVNKDAQPRYAAMALVKIKPGLVEIFVSECDSEAAGRELIDAALAVYL